MVFKKTCIIAALWLIACAQGSMAQTLTSVQAIQIATTFCQNMGYPVTAQATTVYPAVPLYTSQPDTFWLARWDVSFPGQAEVWVVDTTSAVSRYYNIALADQLEAANQAAGAPISQASAIQFAGSVLTAAAPMDPVASPVAQYSTLIANPTTATATWNVIYCRMFQGIPYRGQEANIILQAGTGGVLVFSLVFPSPPPSSGPGQVTSAQALTTANTQVANAGLTTAVFQSSSQVVVQPNTYWQAGGNDTPQSGVSNVVWDCFYSVGALTYEVWVDTVTGNVDGGDVSSPGKARKKTATKPVPANPPTKTVPAPPPAKTAPQAPATTTPPTTGPKPAQQPGA